MCKCDYCEQCKNKPLEKQLLEAKANLAKMQELMCKYVYAPHIAIGFRLLFEKVQRLEKELAERKSC